jgi:anaerobic magnesium-protoporphyrin IX monomethyl ester cyclase
MKKIVLIEPQSKEDHVYKHVRMPRLGLPILGTQLKEAGYQVSIYMGTGNALPWAKIYDADLVGISTTTATCREAYQIAGLLRSESIPVVIGGIHATFLPEEALEFADYIIHGEAEYSFLPLVQAIESGRQPHNIPGVSYWSNGTPVHNPPLESRVEMNKLPIPDLSLLDRFSALRTIPVMTSRGCPFNCTFCCVTEMFGRRYRFRSTESILKELGLYQGRAFFSVTIILLLIPNTARNCLRGSSIGASG